MGDNHTTAKINEVVNNEVAETRPASSLEDLREAFPARDSLRYVRNDAFVADPSKLLGRVYYERVDEDELVPFLTRVSVAVDDASKLTAPQTVSELVIDTKAAASAEFLAFASLSIGHEEVLELRVLNNAAARAVDSGDEWDDAVEKWFNTPRCQVLLDDPEVTSVSVVTGVVQKYLIGKKYKKFEAGAKGGFAGLSVSGTLYTSSSEFSLDVVYGVDLVSFGHRAKPKALRDAVAAVKPLRKQSDLAELGDKFEALAKRGDPFGSPKMSRAR